MILIKVMFENKDHLTTRFNGTMADAEEYYLGTIFNLGDAQGDLMVKCESIELLKESV